VIGLGDTPNLDFEDTSGYELYLARLANAGSGQPVKMVEGYQFLCVNPAPEATYSAAAGTAQAYQAFTADDVKAAVNQILGSSICP
jgi:hypothetical protein